MKIKIFTGPLNYKVENVYKEEKKEYLIVVDQACHLFEDLNMEVDLAIGDFDSAKIEMSERIMDCADRVIVFPKEKDHTDTYLAVQEALKMKHDEIIIYGALGKRIDHTLANIQLLKMGNVRIENETTSMYLIYPGKHEIKTDRKYISFFAVEDVKSLTLKGFKYSMNSYNLSIYDPLCVSNEGSGTVDFKDGVLLVIEQDE